MPMSKDLQLSPVFGVEYTQWGIPKVAFYFDYVPNSVRYERVIGMIYAVDRIIEVSPVHWLKTLDELLALWKSGDLENDASVMGETTSQEERS